MMTIWPLQHGPGGPTSVGSTATSLRTGGATARSRRAPFEVAAGEQAVMADAVKALGQGV